MLLLHQAGSVKVGEVVRYTLTYTPSNDRILPTPSHLHVKVKNTSAIPLRAAWVHGPYCLHVAAYPATFNPYQKTEDPSREGEPQYEPMLKAAGHWHAKLLVPEDIRETGAHLGKRKPSMQESGPASSDGKGSVTWIIEIASQILFSNSASVNFELLAGRDERSLDLGFAAVAGHGHGGPGHTQVYTTEQEKQRAHERGHVQTAGVYTKAVKLVVEDTDVLWDKPRLPSSDNETPKHLNSLDEKDKSEDVDVKSTEPSETKKKKKKIHLVVVTHGLHSNLGADMLFLKESVDATVKQARIDARKRKEGYRTKRQASGDTNASEMPESNADVGNANEEGETATAPLSGGQEELENAEIDSQDDEETIVRGFTGNAVRTENGIQYLGKRLAKYILRFTYPDQLYLPVKKPITKALSDTFRSEEAKARRDGLPSHTGSSIHHPSAVKASEELAYTFSKISFIGHSLGGLIQTYAIAYIHKHNPSFFKQIQPINFICMASPMLGLSNENPMYVKFALDFGLVGRTGQDLGLAWNAPSLAKGSWNAVIGGLGSSQKDQAQKDQDPRSKPLLRILPTGPAHQVLRMFRNRTVYSNVVNDGIVPLRTSCLLFLDWRGLGKVDKARRENGLIGTVAEWGWAEITGQNSSTLPERVVAERVGDDDDDENEHVRHGDGEAVPQPDEDEIDLDARRVTTRDSFDETMASQVLSEESTSRKNSQQQESNMWDSFLGFFRPRTPTPDPERRGSKERSKKTKKAFTRGQTVEHEEVDGSSRGRSGTTDNPILRPHFAHSHTGQVDSRRASAGKDKGAKNGPQGLEAPPKTSIFESAGDILHPPLPSRAWLIDPSSRVRTIFHDRVYHPEDIPPPPRSRQGSRFTRSLKSELSLKSMQSADQSVQSQDSGDAGGMKVEEKIARAYHRDLSWRKVLVRLEPDAHNNMIVRRMFANAYGWPVIKHLCDTHFADTHAARTRDEDEPARERAVAMDEPLPETGEEVAEQTARQVAERTESESREARDELSGLEGPREGASSSYSSKGPSLPSRSSTGTWDDAWFEGDDDDDSDIDERNLVQRLINPMAVKKPEPSYQPSSPKANGEPRAPTQPYTDGHRGLSPTTSRRPDSAKSAASTKPTFDAGNLDTPAITDRLSEEPESLGRTTDIGLRKSVEEQVTPTKSKRSSRPGSSPPDEAVAKKDFS